MLLLPIKTRRIIPGDDIANVLLESAEGSDFRASDIIVISSKAIATAEGRIVDLSKLTPRDDATKLAEECQRSPAFCEAVLEEAERRHGIVCGTCPGAILTELRPHGLPSGSLFTANAGLDESNTEQGTAVGWPRDPVRSARILRQQLKEQMREKGKGVRTEERYQPFSLSPYPFSPHLAVIITDSCVRPRRWGVTAFALTVAGIDPLKDEAGREDLFGRKLRITKEAIADQLATAANMLMGNADQAIPAVIVRDHGLALSDYEGWVPGIEPEEDLFRGAIRKGF